MRGGEPEPLPLMGGPLDGQMQQTVARHVEVPIEPCDNDRVMCIGRYAYDGWDTFEYEGHHKCGVTYAERTREVWGGSFKTPLPGMEAGDG